MASRMDEFRAFLTKYPGIVEDVKTAIIVGNKCMKTG